jgi:hypothetical protein
MDASNDISDLGTAVAESSESTRTTTAISAEGLHPIVAVLIALWYSFTAAAAMSRGFAYLYEGSKNDYTLEQDLM